MIYVLLMISGYLSSLPVNYKSDSIHNLTIYHMNMNKEKYSFHCLHFYQLVSLQNLCPRLFIICLICPLLYVGHLDVGL